MIKLTQRFRDILGSEHDLIERIPNLDGVERAKKRLKDAVTSEHGILIGNVVVESE